MKHGKCSWLLAVLLATALVLAGCGNKAHIGGSVTPIESTTGTEATETKTPGTDPTETTATEPTGGETFEELYARCKSFIEDIIFPAEDKYESMLIVGHGALIRGFIHNINNRPSKDFWMVTHKNCSVTIAECINGKLSLLEEAKIYYHEEIQSTW